MPPIDLPRGKPKRVVRKVSPTAAAKAQQAGYVSQGAAVAKAAQPKKVVRRVAPSGQGARVQAELAPKGKPPGRLAAYDALAPAEKRALIRALPAPAAAPLAHVHAARVARNRALAAAEGARGGGGMDRANAYLANHPEILNPEHGRQLSGGLTQPAVLWSADPKILAAAGFKPDQIDKALHKPAEFMRNAGRDAAELAVTTPSSVAKLASTAVTHPERVPGMLAQPYIDFAKDPLNVAFEHPVSTGLMLAPGVRVPGRAVGRAARLTGKQTLARPAATLPGTALRQARTGSRDFAVRALQARADRKAPAPTMTDAQVQRRVDEFYDVSQQHRQRAQAAAVKQAKASAKAQGLSGSARREAIAAKVQGAAGGASKVMDERFAREFGATWQRTPSGAIVKPKTPSEGVIHASRADADAIAAKVPFDAVVRRVGDGYAVLPRVAVVRRAQHGAVGSSQAIGAKVFRTGGKLFRGAVLPLSTKWLTGQATEAGLRSAVAGAGPMSLLREHRTFKALEAQQPGAGVAFRQRTSSGGQFGLTGTAREFADGTKTLADEFANTAFAKPAAAATKAGAAPGVKQLRRGWDTYTRFVFDVVNGAIETTAQRAMTGKAIKTGPLMERHVLALSDKAIKDAAEGLRGTEAQVELGRQVERMYGAYSRFSPAKRETLLHTTPFWPWYANSAKFLTRVLPGDHPVLASVLAATSVLEEDWRKANHQSLLDPNHAPSFLLGGYPAATGNGVVRLGKYTPFSAAQDPAAAVADLVLPQFSGAHAALQGIDWTGHRLKRPGYQGAEFSLAERLAAAAAAQANAMVPGVGPAGRITGIQARYIDKKNEPSVFQGKPLGPALRKEYDPFMATGHATPPVATTKRGVAVKIKPPKPMTLKPLKLKPTKKVVVKVRP